MAMGNDELKYEFIVRPPSTRRHVDEVMRGIASATGIKYEIQRDRDRLVVQSDRELAGGERERLTEPQNDITLGASLATPASVRAARRERLSADLSRPSSRASKKGPPNRSGSGSSSSATGGDAPPMGPPKKRVSWHTAVNRALDMRITGKTALQRLGVVRWGTVQIRSGVVLSADKLPGGGNHTRLDTIQAGPRHRPLEE